MKIDFPKIRRYVALPFLLLGLAFHTIGKFVGNAEDPFLEIK